MSLHKNPARIFDSVFTIDNRLKDDGTREYVLPPVQHFSRSEPWEYLPLRALQKSIEEIKSRISAADPSGSAWVPHVRRTLPNARLVSDIRAHASPELCSATWAKLYQILSQHESEIFPRFVGQASPFVSIHLNESSGSSVSAVNHWLHSNPQHGLPSWNWMGMTFNPSYEGHDPRHIHSSRFMSLAQSHWCNGCDDTGDVVSVHNVALLKQKAQNAGSRVCIVIADGSYMYVDDPEVNDVAVDGHLVFAECVAALAILDVAGALIVRTYSCFDHSAICTFYLLLSTFERVAIRKPAASRSTNSECYWVCTGFLGIDTVSLDVLQARLRSLCEFSYELNHSPVYSVDSLDRVRSLTDAFATRALFMMTDIPEAVFLFLSRSYEAVTDDISSQVLYNLDTLTVTDNTEMKRLHAFQHNLSLEFIRRTRLNRISPDAKVCPLLEHHGTMHYEEWHAQKRVHEQISSSTQFDRWTRESRLLIAVREQHTSIMAELERDVNDHEQYRGIMLNLDQRRLRNRWGPAWQRISEDPVTGEGSDVRDSQTHFRPTHGTWACTHMLWGRGFTTVMHSQFADDDLVLSVQDARQFSSVIRALSSRSMNSRCLHALDIFSTPLLHRFLSSADSFHGLFDAPLLAHLHRKYHLMPTGPLLSDNPVRIVDLSLLEIRDVVDLSNVRSAWDGFLEQLNLHGIVFGLVPSMSNDLPDGYHAVHHNGAPHCSYDLSVFRPSDATQLPSWRQLGQFTERNVTPRADIVFCGPRLWYSGVDTFMSQEVLRKRHILLYLIGSLYCLRKGGVLIIRLRDILSRFSAHVLLLLHSLFDEMVMDFDTTLPCLSDKVLVCKGYVGHSPENAVFFNGHPVKRILINMVEHLEAHPGIRNSDVPLGFLQMLQASEDQDSFWKRFGSWIEHINNAALSAEFEALVAAEVVLQKTEAPTI
jgi:hypothetical protein